MITAILSTTGLEINGIGAAVEQRPGEFRAILISDGKMIAAGKWEAVRSREAMWDRADALLRRHTQEASHG